MARTLSACLKLTALAMLARLAGRDRLADHYGAEVRYRVRCLSDRLPA